MEPQGLDRTGEDSERADDWLRRRLQPTEAQVERLVRGAMATGGELPTARRWVPLAAATAVLAVVAAALVWQVTVHSRRPEGAVAGASGDTAVAIITNASGQVELRLRPEPASRPTSFRVSVFNCERLVVAAVTNGGVRYVLVGGES